MGKGKISMLLVLTMCVNLITGCSTAAMIGTGAQILPSTADTNQNPLPNPSEIQGPGTTDLTEDGYLVTDTNRIYCVRYEEEDYIIGKVCDSTTMKPIAGAKVTLLDAHKEKVLDEKGKACSAVTVGEWVQFDSDIPTPILEAFHLCQFISGNFFLDVPEDGDPAVEKTYWLKVEHENYYPTEYPVTYFDIRNYQKQFEAWAMAEGSEVDNARELVQTLLKLSKEDVEQFCTTEQEAGKAYQADTIFRNKAAVLNSAVKVTKMTTRKEWDAFWNTAWDNVTLAWDELPSAIWNARPDRLRAWEVEWRATLVSMSGFGTYAGAEHDKWIEEQWERADKIKPGGWWFQDPEFLEFLGLDPYSVGMDAAIGIVTSYMLNGSQAILQPIRVCMNSIRKFQLNLIKSMDDLMDTAIGTKPGVIPAFAGEEGSLLRLTDDLEDAGNSIFLSMKAQKQINGTLDKLDKFSGGRAVNAAAAQKLQGKYPELGTEEWTKSGKRISPEEIKEAYQKSIEEELTQINQEKTAVAKELDQAQRQLNKIDDIFELQDEIEELQFPDNPVTRYLLLLDKDKLLAAVPELDEGLELALSGTRKTAYHELGHLFLHELAPDSAQHIEKLGVYRERLAAFKKLEDWFLEQATVDVEKTGVFMKQIGLGEYSEDFMVALNRVMKDVAEDVDTPGGETFLDWDKMDTFPGNRFPDGEGMSESQNIWEALWDRLTDSDERVEELKYGGTVRLGEEIAEDSLQADYADMALSMGGPVTEAVWNGISKGVYGDLKHLEISSRLYVRRYLIENLRQRMSPQNIETIESLFGEPLAALVRLELYQKCEGILSACKHAGNYEKFADYFKLGGKDREIIFRDAAGMTEDGRKLERLMRESFGEDYKLESLQKSEALEDAVSRIADKLEAYKRLDAEGFALEDKIEELEGIEIEIDRDITRLRKLKKEVDNWDLGFDTAAILNLLLSKMDSYKMLLGKATLFLAFASQINGNAGFAESGDGWNLQTKDVIYLRPVDRDGLISGLAGKVIIAGTDTPIKGARVELRFWDGSQWQPAGIRSSQSDGSYTFGIKEWGSYNLIVRAEGYQERQYAFMAEEGELVGPERVELIPLIKTTPIPSTSPTATSKATPTTSPTAEPTLKPTPNPTPNQTPTAVPTMIPTPAPTVSPTPIWTPAASPAPTEIPGGIATPTVKWTAVPTAQPIAAD